MPVQRFHDFDAARRALWTDSKDPNLAARIRRLWARSARLVAPTIPRGLRKFRGIDEANREREAWLQNRIAQLRAGRSQR